MDRDKKSIAIVVLSIALIISGVGNLLLSFGPRFGISPPISRIFIVGTSKGPSELDPIQAEDSASKNVIEQVCEGLYTHNLSDPNLGIIPRLAVDYGIWDPSGTRYTISLRQNVSFHDGTPFNAEAVKWNFERINWFTNGTGTLNTTLSKTHSLWEFPNGTTILDPTDPVTINSEYSVIINLRAPYAILESLLCHESAFILSPNSTPKYEYISTTYGRIVGTGPFVYDYYVADKEVKFHRWDNYWREPAFFEEVTFAVIEDATTRNNAMLGHTIDYLLGSISSLFPTYDADPTITHRAGGRALSYYYLGMNNNKINKTWRQAISYAINYTYITEELRDGTVFRSNSPLAPNFPMYDPTIQAATYNLTKAREIVVSMGFGDMSWTDVQWQAANFATWNYTYNAANSFRRDLSDMLQNNLDQIGITVKDRANVFCSASFCLDPHLLPDFKERVQLYWFGWGSDILSPYDMIYPLFSNQSEFNWFQYHNHTVEMWLEEILRETNAIKRAELYSKILHQIVEIDMPHAFGYHPYQHSVHSADIHGVPYNSMSKFYIYPMYRA